MELAKQTSVADAFADGRLYLHRSTFSCNYYGRCDKVHVMSRPAGGEIRGYQRSVGSDGPWTICTPNHMGAWPELDAAVMRLASIEIAKDAT